MIDIYCFLKKGISMVDKSKCSEFFAGFRSGIIIFTGYLPAGISFGIFAVRYGLSPVTAMLFSALNISSSGQFSGVRLISSGATILEIILTTILVNLRFGLLSLGISQKWAKNVPFIAKLVFAHGITDETYAVAMQQHSPLSTWYFAGLTLPSIVGWSGGTLLGAKVAAILSPNLQAASGIILYSMFVALMIPQARGNKAILETILLSAGFASAFYCIRPLNQIPQGWIIILCTVIVCSFMAVRYPEEE